METLHFQPLIIYSIGAIMISIDEKTFKTVAQKFAEEIGTKYLPGVKIQHAFKLEALSHAFGYRDYNTIKPHLEQTDKLTVFPLLPENSNLHSPNRRIEWNPIDIPSNPHTLNVGSVGSQTFSGDTGDECFYLFSIDTTVPCSNLIDDVLSLFQMSKEKRNSEVQNNLFSTCRKDLLPYSKLLDFFIMANFTKGFLRINVHYLPDYFEFKVIEFLARTRRKHGIEKLILAIDGSSINNEFIRKSRQNGVHIILTYSKTVEDTISDYQQLIKPKSSTKSDDNKYKELFEKLRENATKYGIDIKMARKELLMPELVFDLQEKEKEIKHLEQVVDRLHRSAKIASEDSRFKLNSVVAREKMQALLDDIGEHMGATDVNALLKAIKVLEKNQTLDNNIYQNRMQMQAEMDAGRDLE